MTTTVGFSGHQGLTPATEAKVNEELRQRLRDIPNLVGVTMLGPGADQLFAQVVLELGGALYVVEPTQPYTIYRDGFDDTTAQRRYDELYGRASYFENCGYPQSTEQAHMDGGRAVVNASNHLFAVWDGEPSRGVGGTADVVAYARSADKLVTVIWPEGASRE
jgi:hypothetical protein